ncbi:MAG: hypothetical protein A3G34_15145 [Candidatus Lindowbacteria bacterium RIFCSPLOWO2_12_FULL_62_27]|nr:MAG: hypothetical protein A3G34_15145 [Candidatus Lindowbacteria bacterium RIFCSPLOWO2_12_FULL_62_27]OGH63861.1 MAG: hypothetical protein A3I06_06125 [Candidatus Lindowbacteria bacterium RIFCSPLOWO2_02_FULL_62_12]
MHSSFKTDARTRASSMRWLGDVPWQRDVAVDRMAAGARSNLVLTFSPTPTIRLAGRPARTLLSVRMPPSFFGPE